MDVADAARVLSGRMVADLLGLPAVRSDDACRELFAAGERLARLALGTTASTDLDPAVLARARAIVAGLTAAVPDAYRTAGPDTLLGRCRAMGLGLPLSRGLATLLVIAGTETGASGTARTAALLHDTGRQRALLDDPSLMDAAVREGLRVTAPAPLIGRHVARDATVGGPAAPRGRARPAARPPGHQRRRAVRRPPRIRARDAAAVVRRRPPPLPRRGGRAGAGRADAGDAAVGRPGRTGSSPGAPPGGCSSRRTPSCGCGSPRSRGFRSAAPASPGRSAPDPSAPGRAPGSG
ncbi:hypothetical protein LUX33_41120 [Actinomadura madurae]|uniref:hypothetical protein n=1 Tax=Actinomadura madurae TaxID=1993 RepID=UPI0020D22223|nr:hypothetical protein [Actinomadura madurae]MCP9954190.1 hypothetical protein [Actinomadura madurae]